jgi:ABC-type transport system involved in multi-copper enzyme maturation permease subunit
VIRQLRANLGLLGAMVGLVVVVILLHALNLPADKLGRSAAQLMVMGQGQRLGTLFAALLGAMAITVEFRHGTIRPTLLATPRRGQVVAAKVGVSMLIGIALGLIATAIAIGVEIVALKARGIGLQLVASDYSQLLFGSAAGAMLWAAIGVGLGAVVRNQVPIMVGICTWLLFVEGLLFGDIGLSDYGRLLPGALAQAASGLDPQKQLLAPGLSLLLLALYAVVAGAAGWLAISRRDVA